MRIIRLCLSGLMLTLAACASPQPTQIAQPDPQNRSCLKETGTRIPRKADDPKDCVAAPGQSYSRQDLERTGRIDNAEALRSLSPAIQ